MLKKNDLIKLSITAMTFEGLGVGRYSGEDCNEFVIFVHNTIVGEIVTCRIVKVLPKYAFGIPESFDVISEERTDPECPTFRRCGGCSFSHVAYESELSFKKEFIVDAFHKNFPRCSCEISDVVPSPYENNYRNKAQYPVSQNGKCGFYAKNTHKIIEIEDCKLNDPEFTPIIRTLEKHIALYKIPCYNEQTGNGLIRHLYLRKAPATDEIMACIVINGQDIPHKEQLTSALSAYENVKSVYLNINQRNTNVILGKECRLLWGNESITDILCGLKFDIAPLSFYQVNSSQAENLYAHVKDSLNLTKNDIVLDLYCGIGTIGLFLANKVKKVIGIEAIEQAVTNACQNAVQNDITNAVFYIATAAETLTILDLLPENRPTVLILDPPRKGLDEPTLHAVGVISPQRIAYISCNPSTLARDLSLIDGYEIKSLQPFDMFPRTSHVECVAILERKQ